MPGKQTPFWQMSPLQHMPQIDGPHAAFSAMHIAAPPSHAPGSTTTVWVHCAMWLCAETSWNGSQNAGKLGSVVLPPSSAVDRLIAAIQICGWLQFGGSGCECEPVRFCGESGGKQFT